ncbi:MAG: hypothetical protein L6R38_007442 [Xanthoria sp. 2 TBL-2021]|nr:MAG: hypothetical protein L6R38_007442 [Xanthoria sp. 2 TBL-2021]
MRIPFIRIFYSTSFTILGLILAVLLLLTPANLIYEAFRRRKIYSIIIVAAVYVLASVVAVLLYASRLYANRRALLHIPKAWSPLEKGHVENRVRKLVAEKLDETAAIAFESRPRDLSKDTTIQPGQRVQSTVQEEHSPQSEEPIPPWGIISHPGWSSPSSPDLPHLQLNPIIHELSNLVEAKAVSLAPPDPLYSPSTTTTPTEPPLPDALIVEYLQRPATMNLRSYISHLTALGMLTQPALTTQFLSLYEKARFSGTPISEHDFRTLMALFADILRNLQPLHPSIIHQIRNNGNDNNLNYDDQDQDSASLNSADGAASFISNNTVQHTPHPDPERYYTPRPERYSLSSGSEAGSEGTVRTAPSHPNLSRRELSRTSTSRSGSKGFRVEAPSRSSQSELRLGLRTKKSFASSVRSQGSQGSVIRLAEARTELDLPYTIVAPGEMGL